MPLRNRVTPEGDICAVPERGLIYGNRGGCFHRDDGTLLARHWANRQWICCVLSFKGRRRRLLQPGLFTELFFLDEATAFAAGHRPCFECRRADAVRFAALWAQAHALAAPPRAPEMDLRLHAERLDGRARRTHQVTFAALPAGSMVRHEGRACLVSGDGRLRPWSFAGYGSPLDPPAGARLELLTPPATVAVLACGYRPLLHPTALV